MKHRIRPGTVALALLLVCTACTTAAKADPAETLITLSDSGVTVEGQAASTAPSSAVYVGADIVYYQSGQDSAYGEGTDADAHTADEAGAHIVVTITQPGVYRVTGTLSAGQLAVDLGAEAASDPGAVVTLLLDGADITCTVAPAVIFYSVYECGSADAATASPTVDTAAAGANVVLADGSVNNITGSYVAKIYREGTEKKLHKYDGAFYSKMSMNVTGQTQGTGVLNLTAENEGLDAELHLTINGGVINITAQNDGINTNEDGVSVTTVNGGTLTINAGLGTEGDGIDSNGYLVINGGTVTALANPKSGDGGLDADLGIYLNGGTVAATGSRNDQIDAASAQQWIELNFASPVSAGSTVTLLDAAGNTVLEYMAHKDLQAAVFSGAGLAPDTAYTLYVDGAQQQHTGQLGGFGGGRRPGDGILPEGGTLPEGEEKPQRPQGEAAPTPPDGVRPGGIGGGQSADATPSTDFTLTGTARSFGGISAASGGSGQSLTAEELSVLLLAQL